MYDAWRPAAVLALAALTMAGAADAARAATASGRPAQFTAAAGERNAATTTTIRWIPGTATHPGTIGVAAGTGKDHIESSANGTVRRIRTPATP